MAVETIKRTVDFLLGQTDGQKLKRYHRHVQAINALSEKMERLSDQALAQKTTEFKQQLEAGGTKEQIRDEAFAVVREVAARTVGMRPFDVQILGAIALDERKIAEMATGEG